ncbi:MAG: peptidoglycan-binding protein [Clostridia bacterium]|nr:peptidoglycan-binding protein [Clostridia bacterium]
MRIRKILAALTAFCLLALSAPLAGAMADSHYYITVDLTNQIVTVYDSEKTDDTNIVRQMICSSGRSATPTPTGTYHLPSRGSSERSEWYYFPKFKCYAKWATRITGGILFHSTLYTSAKKGPTSSSTRALGSKASHGCVRLRVSDAKFIAQNCGTGTKCRIYSSGKTNSKLRSKLKRKSFIRDKQTYDSFMGRKPKESPLPLGRGSTGSLVTQMQTRLKALGYYGGEINGVMGKSTVAAAKAFQGACGVKKTGRVNQVLWNVMFADSAPVGMEITLAEGSSGPAVAALQTNLITLLMMQGDADGSFTAATAEGVRNYQNTFGYAVTGAADGNLQTDIADRAAQVRQSFGSTPYALSVVTTDARMARVKAHSGARLRQTASKKGKMVKKLKYKSSMRVLSDGKLWTKVRANGRTGYVKRSALTFYNENVTENGYVEVSLPTETTAEATTPTTAEVSIPTQADSAPADTDTVAAEADGIIAEASDAAMAAYADDSADPELRETPDDGLEMEVEPVPEQAEEIVVEASEEDIVEVSEDSFDEAPEDVPGEPFDDEPFDGAALDDVPAADAPADEGDMLTTSEE